MTFYDDWQIADLAREHVERGINGDFYPEMPEEEMLSFFLTQTIRGRRWSELAPQLEKTYTTIEEAIAYHDACEKLLEFVGDPDYDSMAGTVDKLQQDAIRWLVSLPRSVGTLFKMAGTDILIPEGSPWRASTPTEEWESGHNYFNDHIWSWHQSGRLELQKEEGWTAYWCDTPDFDDPIYAHFPKKDYMRIYGPDVHEKAYLPLPESRRDKWSSMKHTHRLFFYVKTKEK